MAEMRVEVLKKEIEVLRKEQSGKGACVRQESARCHASTLELGHPKNHDGGRRSISQLPRGHLKISGHR